MLNVVQLLNTQPTLEQLASAANKSVMFDGMCVIEKSEKYVNGTRNWTNDSGWKPKRQQPELNRVW